MALPLTPVLRAGAVRALACVTRHSRPATVCRTRVTLVIRTAAIALAAGGLLAACGTAAGPGAAPTKTVTAQASPPTSPSTSTSTSAAPANAAAAGPPACLASALQAALGVAQGTAGTFYQVVVLTNASASTCTLYGYPGVSFVTASGQQVGAAGTRNPAVPSTVVTLVPGGQANMLIALHDAGAYPPAQCKPASVDVLRIYPPGDYGSIEVKYSAQTCSSQAEVIMSVTAVRAGAGSASA